MAFCRNCGKPMADDAVFCQACGHSAAGPAQAAGGPSPASLGKVSVWWWLLPIFFAVLGGAVSYLAARDSNMKTAKRMLILGVVMTPIDFFLLLVFGAALITAITTPV